ncbi:MAG TPA: class I SAM-dependent methyltransferase [Kofleriaceae bacterium]|nr:class I SAM-dependent methyltransferase [Kofleriaceae bacterium]
MSDDNEPEQHPAPAPATTPTFVHSKPLLDPVLREEAEFANRDYAAHANDLELSDEMFAKYSRPAELWDWRQLAAMMLGNVKGKALLDYGCGMGEESVYWAKLGAQVTAIDISEVGVSTTKRRAEYHKLDIHAFEMRCDPTSFPAASFDRIHGMGILHHVGIDNALAEVWRLLRPGGIAVFLEPMGDHPGIEAVKEFLMRRARFLGDFDEVTDHEHNLRWAEIEEATKRFARYSAVPFHLLYRLKRFAPYKLHTAMRRIDAAMLTLAPSLKRYCGAVAIQV